MGIFHTLAHETYVGYDAEHLVGEFLVECHGLLVVAREYHLGAPAHAQHFLMLVERLGREDHTLFEQEFI